MAFNYEVNMEEEGLGLSSELRIDGNGSLPTTRYGEVRNFFQIIFGKLSEPIRVIRKPTP